MHRDYGCKWHHLRISFFEGQMQPSLAMVSLIATWFIIWNTEYCWLLDKIVTLGSMYQPQLCLWYILNALNFWGTKLLQIANLLNICRFYFCECCACGICPLCLYSHEPCGFSTFLYVAVVTHVTPHDALYELHKVISSTKRRDYCFFNLLLSNAPDLDQRYTANNGVQVYVEWAHETRPFWRLHNTLPLFMPLAAITFGAMLWDYHVYVVLLGVSLQERRSDSCLKRFCHTTRWNSKPTEHFSFSMWDQGWKFFYAEI